MGVLGSCNSIVYDEEYSADGFYHSQNAVYFHYPEAQDYREISTLFAALPRRDARICDEDSRAPRRVCPQNRTQKFKLMVDPSSTMKEGVHYKAFNLEQEIPADSVNAVVPVTLLRNGLSPDKDTLNLVLRLVETSDLALKFPNAQKVEIQATKRAHRTYLLAIL